MLTVLEINGYSNFCHQCTSIESLNMGWIFIYKHTYILHWFLLGSDLNSQWGIFLAPWPFWSTDGGVFGAGLEKSLVGLGSYWMFSQRGCLLLLMANFLPNITQISLPQHIIIAFLLWQMDLPSAASEFWTKESKLAEDALVPSIVIVNWKKAQAHWELRSQQDYSGGWIRNGLACCGRWVTEKQMPR